MKMTWSEWLWEPVDWNSLHELPRWKAIRYFVRDGLTPFLAEKGYAIGSTPSSFRDNIATGLYMNQGLSHVESDWSFGHINTEYMDAEKIHFYDVLDSDAWSEFWSIWSHWSDLSDDDPRGPDRRYDIEAYCWTQVNTAKSAQTGVIMDILGIHDGGGGGRPASPTKSFNWGNRASTFVQHQQPFSAREDDTYLKEAADSGLYDGYRR